MRVTSRKLYMAGISISLAVALAACGGGSNTTAASGTTSLQTLSGPVTLQTRSGTTNENPINLTVVEENEKNITVEFDGFHDLTAYEIANGVAIAYAEIPKSYAADYNISAEAPGDVDPEIWEKVHLGWDIKTLASTTDANRTRLTVTGLEPNHRYAFRVASFVVSDGLFGSSTVPLATGMTLFSGTGLWHEITTQGKTLEASPVLTPCVEGSVACLYDERKCDWFYGAHVDWCLPEGLTHVNLYRGKLDTNGSVVASSFKNIAAGLTEPTQYDDKNVTQGETYRYTVEAYYMDGTEKVYADTNATVDLFIEPYTK